MLNFIKTIALIFDTYLKQQFGDKHNTFCLVFWNWILLLQITDLFLGPVRRSFVYSDLICTRTKIVINLEIQHLPCYNVIYCFHQL